MSGRGFARRSHLAALAAAAVLVAAPVPAPAQNINLASGDSSQPIEVFADDGIEWQREDEILIARGNARASRGGVTVHGDVLRAFYRRKPAGGTALTRLDAEGSVRIVSEGQEATGETAVYDLAKAIVVLRGREVRFASDEDVVTARQQIEYYERRNMAVARGDATATREGRTVRAAVLVAFLRTGRDGKARVFRVQAFDDVLIATDQDTVRSDKGVYNVDSGIATLTGNVRINRGQNQLAGERAEVNLNTGISKLLTVPGEQSGKRVRGLLLPEEK